MKNASKLLTGVLVGMLVTALGQSGLAQDATALHYVEILPNQAATLEKTDLLLIGPVSVTNGQASTGSVVDVSSYEGRAIVVAGHSTNVTSTSVVSIAYAYTNSMASSVTMLASTQTTAAAKFDSYEFDIDTIQGTNNALYLRAIVSNVAGTTTGIVGSAVLVYDAARSQSQTNSGSAVDVAAYKGNGCFLVSCAGAVNEATSYTNTVTIQHSTTGTNGWTTVTNTAGTAGTVTLTGATASVQEYDCDLARLHKYVRAISVQENDVGGVSVILSAPMKSE